MVTHTFIDSLLKPYSHGRCVSVREKKWRILGGVWIEREYILIQDESSE